MSALRQLVFRITFIRKPMRTRALRNSNTVVRGVTATGRRYLAT
jgi:hypothetical protein